MVRKKLKPTEEVFSYFLANQISTTDKSFDLLNELKSMAELGVRPSVYTFNAALVSLFEVKVNTFNSI